MFYEYEDFVKDKINNKYMYMQHAKIQNVVDKRYLTQYSVNTVNTMLDR